MTPSSPALWSGLCLLSTLISVPALGADANAGKVAFRAQCALCHSAEPNDNGGAAGADLNDVLGRKAASGDFTYTKALRDSNLTWDAATLDRFLASPTTVVPGSSMVVAVPKKDDRDNIIAYFQEVKAGTFKEVARPGFGPPPMPANANATPPKGDADWKKDAPGRVYKIASCSVASLAALAMTSMTHAAAPDEIAIPGERVFPESLTSTADGSVIIGSIGARTVFRAKPGAATADAWIQPGTDGAQGIFGVLADDKSNTLWACSGAFAAPGGPPPPPSALHAFDLKTGAPKGRYPLPTAGGSCNDIAIGPDGTAYATDTSNMELLRLKKGGSQLEVWVGNGAFGPQGGVLDGIAVLGNRVIVNVLLTSKLFSVPVQADGKPGTVAEIKLNKAIERPDGMRSFGKDSLLVVESDSGRLSRVTLKGDAGTVTTIKEGYPDGPVSVTVVGETAYVLEGQLDALMRPTADAKLKPFHATAVAVGKP